MKAFLLFFGIFLFQHSFLFSQATIDTLAFQDFEVSPQAPVWGFTGPVIYNSGFSTAAAAPANSPLGIGGSRAWETTTNSSGLILDFNNTVIPSGYDSIHVHFNLAAMNLIGASGGPDNLDYVLVAYSLDNGTSFVNRLRIRGAINDNSFWAYDATGVASTYYLPATETTFQPTNSGLATTLGYSNCEIVFPGSITQLQLKITGRSSSSSDTWLIDNVVLTAEDNCPETSSVMVVTACDSYTWSQNSTTYSASGMYTDTIPNAAGCDSVITLDLTINTPTYATEIVSECSSYYWSQTGTSYFASGMYNDTITNMNGCDSIVTLNLTILQPTSSLTTVTSCSNYTWTNGVTYSVGGIYTDTLVGQNGCDSIATLDLTIPLSTVTFQIENTCGPFSWSENGNNYATSGQYSVVYTNVAGCDSIITLDLTVNAIPTAGITFDGMFTLTASGGTVVAWIDCSDSSVIAGETGNMFSPSVEGEYAVIVENGSGCSDTSSCQAVYFWGVDETELLNVSLFPNPASDLVTVTFDNSEATLIIYDAQGKLIQTSTIVSGTQISMKSVETGVYFFEISTVNGRTVKRMVKN